MSAGIIAAFVLGFVAGLVAYAAIDGQLHRDARFREAREQQADSDDRRAL